MTEPKDLTSSTLPAVRTVEGVEMIRDGGSLAATFESDGGKRYTLFTKIQVTDDPPTVKRVVGYAQPILIDCDPSKRPPDTATRTYSELGGPSIEVSRSQAREILTDIARLAQGMDATETEWLQEMLNLASQEGRAKGHD